MSDFRTYHPNEFFEKFVVATYEDYLADPLKHHRVKNAVAQLDTMAERMWHWWHQKEPQRVANSRTSRGYREYLARSVCADFQLVWDIHDSHKHVELTRRERVVRCSSQSGLDYSGGAFDAETFDPGMFDVGVQHFIVKLDDGNVRDISGVLQNVFKMWRELLG